MSRMANTAALHRRSYHRAPKVPAGAIVAWEGAVAEIPDGWALCDGTGGTPDLGGRYALGKDATYQGAGGGDFGAVNITVTSAGAHTGTTCLSGGSHTESEYTRAQDSAGAHTHTAAGSASYDPPHCKLACIMALEEAPLPPGAIVWLDAASAGGGFTTYADLQGRFIKGQAGDVRGPAGSENLVYSITGFNTAGAHTHGPVGNTPVDASSTDNYRTHVSSGGHNHDDLIDQSQPASRPPFIALLAARTNRETGAVEGLILAFAGVLADLPDGWFEANGSNGTRDCRGRCPVGAGGAYTLGQTGGEMANVSGTVSTGGKLVNHDHREFYGHYSTATTGRHPTYAWAHAHDVQFTFKKLIPWFGITFIQYLGA